MASEYIVDPITNLNSGTILNDVLHGEILASPTLGDFEGIHIEGDGTRYTFLKTSAWSASHENTLDAVVTAHTGTPLPGGTDISYQTAVVVQDSGTHEIMLTPPNPISTNYTLTLPASVGSTDQILKTTDNSGTLNWGTHSSGPSQIIHYNFGGDLNNTGSGSNANKNFSMYLGKATEGDLAATSLKTRAPIGYNGNLVKVSYVMQDTFSIGIEMRIYVNGNESGGTITYDDSLDFTCPTTTAGVVTFNSPMAVSVGDYIQIQYRNGAAGGSNEDPDDSSWTIYEEVTT